MTKKTKTTLIKMFMYAQLRNTQTERGLYMVELSQYLKVFIIFKIFYLFNIIPIYNQRMLEGAQVLYECSQRTVFQTRQFLSYRSCPYIKMGQKYIGDIRISLATSQDLVRRRAIFLENWLITHAHTDTHTKHVLRQHAA